MESIHTRIEVLKALNDLYKTRISAFSEVRATLKPLTVFGKTTEPGPLQIKGRLLTSGKYKDNTLGEFTLEPEELKKTMKKWIGVPIYTSHKVFQDIITGQNPSVRDVIGKITSVQWNEGDQGIDYFAEIYDGDISEKVLAGLIRFISAGFARDVITEKTVLGYSNFLRNIDPGEASMVFNPRDPQAEFQPVL